MTEQFKFKAEHATRAAVEELKAKFRKQSYKECYKENEEEIAFLRPFAEKFLGLTRARLDYVFRMVSEFAGLY